jgi:lipoprotein-anchoring transpeptidase ErfK/SrfK
MMPHLLMIHISLSKQTLKLVSPSQQFEYTISTAVNGAGQLSGSGCTPLGDHYIRARIGSHQPEGTVFVGRRPTGEIYSEALAATYPDRDWILSRILWLSGTEVGENRLGDFDTMRRYIYIHGTPDTEPMGIPRSHGCIRMRNRDVIQLFEQTPVGTAVSITL